MISQMRRNCVKQAYLLRIVCTLLQNVHWKGQKGLKYSQMCSCWPYLLDLLPFSSKNSEKSPIESREWKSGGYSYSDMQIRAQNAMSDAEQSYDRFKAPIMSQLAYILRIVCTLLQIVHWKNQKGLKYSQICSCWLYLLDLLPFSNKK